MMTVFVLVSLASPASALAYDNTDPGASATGCAGSASTLLSKGVNSSTGQVIGLVELRYSSSCGTKWARITSYIDYRNLRTWSERWSDWASTHGGPGGDPGPYYGTSAYSDQLYGNGYTVCAYGGLPDPNNGVYAYAQACA